MKDLLVPAQTVHHLFSYGTLQLPEVQLSQFGRLLEGSPDALPGHRMTTIQITDPVELFLGWLREAVAAGVPDAHAMTLSTIGEDGGPDARVLILKNVDGDGWQFAVHAHSPKGRQLADRPRAALTFYWPLQGRQVWVRGTVEPAFPEQSAADLLARAPSARAEVLLGRQSEHLESSEERDRAFRTALARIESDPALVSPEWTLYTLVPVEIEFWQADKGRLHNRLRYERPDRHSVWERHMLWP